MQVRCSKSANVIKKKHIYGIPSLKVRCSCQAPFSSASTTFYSKLHGIHLIFKGGLLFLHRSNKKNMSGKLGLHDKKRILRKERRLEGGADERENGTEPDLCAGGRWRARQ